MNRASTLRSLVALFFAVAAPASAYAQAGLVYETESIAGSDIPVTYHLIETDDGLFTPIGLRKPAGAGPFPVVLFATGNGGEGLGYVKDYSHNRGWTLDQFLAAGYAVAWLRYRSEVNLPRYDGTLLTSQPWSGRPVFNRAPFEYEDVIKIIEYVKTLPFIDAERLGYMGVSHAGEMLLKITSFYDGIVAGIASEPAASTFFARRARETTAPADRDEPETATAFDEARFAAAVRETHDLIDRPVAMARVEPIEIPIFVQGRDRDHNQEMFRVSYELLSEAGKNVEWKSYDHDEHGFVYPWRGSDGGYDPDLTQREAVADSIAFFDRHLKGR